MSRSYRVAVVGATGNVGRELTSILAERGFPVSKLSPLVGNTRIGDSVEFSGEGVPLELLCPPSLAGIEIAFFCTPPGVSSAFAGEVTKRRGVVIDVSSTFRGEATVPLIVPEVNASEIELAFRGPSRYLIASPGAVSVALAVALRPLQQKFGLSRVIVSTYQSASGAGKKGLDELHEQTASLLNARDFAAKVFPTQLSFNAIPEVPAAAGFDEDGFSPEERQIQGELRRLLGKPTLDVTATAAFVPTFVGHAAAVWLELESPAEPTVAREALREAPSVLLVDEVPEQRYPMVTNAAGEDAVLVGRVRKTGPRGLWLWLSFDNLRKGAALNAVQIAELVVRDHEGALGPQEPARPRG
jgi:aspartate-semialdehyde dehydrogenase